MIRKAALVVLVVILASSAVALMVDLVRLYATPGEYQQVYGFSGIEKRWSHRSSLNYSLGSLALAGFFLVGVFLGISGLRSAGPASQRLIYVYLTLLAALVLRGLFVWWRGGFDH